jgi:hypothetical protein
MAVRTINLATPITFESGLTLPAGTTCEVEQDDGDGLLCLRWRETPSTSHIFVVETVQTFPPRGT